MPHKDPKERAAYSKRYHAIYGPLTKEQRWRQGVIKRANLRKFLQESKNNPCMDCKQTYPHYVMDYDHRPGEKKVNNLNKLLKKNSLPILKREILKCDLVCANCHRIRTYKRALGLL